MLRRSKTLNSGKASLRRGERGELCNGLCAALLPVVCVAAGLQVSSVKRLDCKQARYQSTRDAEHTLRAQ